MDLGLGLHLGIMPYLNNSYSSSSIPPWSSFDNHIKCDPNNNCIGSLLLFEYASSGHL